MEMKNEGNGRTEANLPISSLSSLRGAQALLTKFIGEAFHIVFTLDSERLSGGAGATEQSVPFRICGHIPPKRFPEELADGPVFALSHFLSLDEEIGRQGD